MKKNPRIYSSPWLRLPQEGPWWEAPRRRRFDVAWAHDRCLREVWNLPKEVKRVRFHFSKKKHEGSYPFARDEYFLTYHNGRSPHTVIVVDNMEYLLDRTLGTRKAKVWISVEYDEAPPKKKRRRK